MEAEINPAFTEFEHMRPIIVPGRSRWRRATFGLMSAAREVDLVFGTAYFVPFAGAPCVANFFDSNIYEHFGTWVRSGRLANALLIRILSDFAVFRSQKLFINSKYCADFLAKKFPRASSKFLVTPPGCTLPRECPDGYRPTWADQIPGDFYLYAGVFSENKNQRRLLHAYSNLQRANAQIPSLLIIGPFDVDYFASAIAPVVRQSPRPNHIILPGRVSDEDLAWAYKHAIAYIQPSIAEGFGLPVVEAMSHGLPVACSNTTSLPETAGDAALLFDPFSVKSIAIAMKRLLDEPTLRQELIEKGSRRWQKFTWERNAKRVAAETEKVLDMLFDRTTK